jgi:hypothetical protein
METRSMFDPRAAALVHAGIAERAASGHAGSSALVTAELAHSVACGLVYVGDQLAMLRVALNENLPTAGRGT